VEVCVVRDTDGEEEEDRPAKQPRLGPGVGKPSPSGTAGSEPSTGTASGEPSTGTGPGIGKPSPSGTASGEPSTTGPGIRKLSPLPVLPKPPKKAAPKHPRSKHSSGQLAGQGIYISIA